MAGNANRQNITLPVTHGGPSNKGRKLPVRSQPGTDPNHYEKSGQHPRPKRPRN